MSTQLEDRDGLLMAYADGELDAAAAAEVELLLAGDAGARQRVEAFRESAALVRAACAEGFYPQVRPGVAVRARRGVGRRWLVAASVLGAAVLGGAGGFGGGAWWAGRSASGTAGLLDQVARYQAVYGRETLHLVEVPAAQTEHLKAWLGNRLQRRLVVPDLSAAGLQFAGGRMLVAGDKPMAQLMYTRDGGAPVALCIAPMGGGAAKLRVEQRGAMRLALWQDAHFAYVVVGDLDAGAALGIAERAEAQIEG